MSAPHPFFRPAFFACVIVLFFVANHGAYKGYFSDDDLDNLGWPTFVGMNVYYDGLLSPKFDEKNFRPVGFLYYRTMYRTFKLRYPAYVVVLQVLHLGNVILLFLLLTRLGFSEIAAAAGALFYAFTAATLEAWWKPMYIFDLLCATLCLFTFLLYVRGRWIIALVTFWLAYKSKELAIMLPPGLLAYEVLLGARRWKRLVPYFVISLSFGLQALWDNREVPGVSPYALHFTPDLLWRSVTFYSSEILFLPFAGLALLLLPILIRDRRLWMGMIWMAATFVPLIVLNGRYAAVYWYVPMLGLAIAVAAIAARTPVWAIALFFALWLPLNYAALRDKRREILARGDENRWYTTGLLDFARHTPPLKAVVFQSTPPHMEPWGVAGAIHLAFGPTVDAVWYKDPKAADALAHVPMAIVGYYAGQHVVKGLLRSTGELASYIRFSGEIPNYQFGPGWQDNAGVASRVASEAEVTLYRPPGSSGFEIVALTPAHSARLTVLENGRPLGTQTLAPSAAQSLNWKLSGAITGNQKITLQTDAGLTVESLGYK